MSDYPPIENILGRVGKDPFVKTAKDKEVVAFTVAKRLQFGDGEGTTQWYDVEVWEDDKFKQFDIAQAVRRGQLIAIEGRVKSRDYNGKTYLTVTPFNIYRVVAIEAGEDDDSAF